VEKMTKCSLCKSKLTEKERIFLPYSKGDFFCKYCYNIIAGCRRCIVCDDEFYYTKKSLKQRFCTKNCSIKYNYLKKKIRNKEYLNDEQKQRAIEYELLTPEK
jgi:hypothetical protein